MHRFGLFVSSIVLATSAARAGTVETSTCTVDVTTVTATGGCSVTVGGFTNYLTGQNTATITASAENFGGFSGFGTPHLTGDAGAEADISIIDVLASPSPSISASAVVSIDIMAYTDGPVRPGFASASGVADGDSECSDNLCGGWSAISSVPILAGSIETIGLTQWLTGGMIPFTLGVPFEVVVGATGSARGTSSIGGSAGGGASGSLDLYAYDADGNPVNIEQVPEPSPFVPTTVAFVIGTLLWRKYRRVSR